MVPSRRVRVVTPGSESWHQKALEMAGEMVRDEYRRLYPGGESEERRRNVRRGMRIRPAYTVPRLAELLVKAVGLHDRKEAEVQVKTLMERVRRGEGELG